MRNVSLFRSKNVKSLFYYLPIVSISKMCDSNMHVLYMFGIVTENAFQRCITCSAICLKNAEKQQNVPK